MTGLLKLVQYNTVYHVFIHLDLPLVAFIQTVHDELIVDQTLATESAESRECGMPPERVENKT